jgi:hypothetical protein
MRAYVIMISTRVQMSTITWQTFDKPHLPDELHLPCSRNDTTIFRSIMFDMSFVDSKTVVERRHGYCRSTDLG